MLRMQPKLTFFVVVVICFHMRLLYIQPYFIGSFTYCVFTWFYIYCFSSKWCAVFLLHFFCFFLSLAFRLLLPLPVCAFTLCFIQLYAMCRCALIKLRTQITYNKYSPHQRQWKRRTNSLFTIISTNAVASTSAEVCLPLAFFYGQYTLKALVCTNKYTYTHIRTCKFEPTYSWLPIYLFYK